MTGVPLRSVPTGPCVSTFDDHDRATDDRATDDRATDDRATDDGATDHGATDGVDIDTESLDAALDRDAGSVVMGTTAVVVAASLLDFLR